MSDKKKNKKTLVGMGKPTAEEIAADAAEKAEAAAAAAEEAAESATEAAEEAADDAKEAVAEAAEEAAERVEAKSPVDADDAESDSDDDSEDKGSEEDEDDAAARKAADDTRAETSSAKKAKAEKKARESQAPDASGEKAAADANDGGGANAAHDGDGGDDSSEDEDETRRPALYLAEYETPEALQKAACKVRDEGFENWDCHTPYPVHGLDDAMGLPPTKIGIISFVHALIGLTTAVLMIQYMNNWDYDIIVGGKPPGAFAPMVPIMFELTVLLTGFGTLFGLLHLAGLPRHHHPIFESDRFAKSTDDKFFISIEVKDPKFDLEKTRELLEETAPSHLELVEEEMV